MSKMTGEGVYGSGTDGPAKTRTGSSCSQKENKRNIDANPNITATDTYDIKRNSTEILSKACKSHKKMGYGLIILLLG